MTYPWDAGDVLLAADLDAAFADRLSQSSGGTITGPLIATGAVTLGSNTNPVVIGSGANAKLTLAPGVTSANSFRMSTNGLSLAIGAAGTNSFNVQPGAAAASTTTLSTSGANGLFQITSGGNINLTPQGTAPVVNIGSGLAPLASGRQKISFAGTGIGGAFTGVDTAQYLAVSFSGTPQVVGPAAPLGSYWAVATDTAAVGTGKHGSVQLMNHNFGGAGLTGGRFGVEINEIFTATSGNAGIGYDPFYCALYAGMSVRANDGGTTKFTPNGGFFAFNPQITAQTGATYLGVAAMEVNVQCNTGSLPTSKVGIQIIKTSGDNVTSLFPSTAIGITDQVGVGVGWDTIYGLGSNGSQWPLAATGTVMQARIGNNYLTNPSTAKRGIDLKRATFSEYFLIGPGGFSVDGSAVTQIGTAYLTPGAAGLSLDVAGSVATAVAIAAGGAGFNTGGARPQVATDAYGGVYVLTTVAAGAVTALTMYRPAYVNGATPANPVALTMEAPFDGTGLTVNLTWSTRTELSLQPSGGPIKAPLLTNAANDAAAAGAGVAVGQLYRNGSVMMQRAA